MNTRVVIWSLISALAGFIFGFDTVVISGAEQTIQALWGLSPGMHGLAIASALYGTVIGALLGAWPADRFGRRATLFSVGILYVVSAIGSALATNVEVFVLARLIGGLGIGISTVAAPLFISEIAPARYRGRLAGLFQFNIVFGIVVAYASNALLSHLGHDAWRWMLGIAAFPSIVYTLLCLLLPESPRWLIAKKGDRGASIAVLKLIEPHATVEAIQGQADAITAASQERSAAGRFWSAALKTPIRLALLVAFFNQFSGINAVLYFAPRIFAMAGLGAQAALLQSVGIGVTILLFTMLGVGIIDKVGRRTLLYIGSYGYIASLGMLAWAFFTQHFSIVPAWLFVFIAAHAVGQGTVIWVLIAEVFPNQHRAEGQSLGSSTHWICAALITTFFPKMVTAFAPGYVFAFFCLMMVIQLIWVRLMVPETKGVALESLERQMVLH